MQSLAGRHRCVLLRHFSMVDHAAYATGVLYTAVHTLMSSKTSDLAVNKAFQLLQNAMQHLNITNIHTLVDEFIASENTEEIVLWSIDNDEKILQSSSNGIMDIIPSEPRKSTGGDHNRYYMPDFLQYLRKCWMNCFGLWTALLRGDLDHHQYPTEGSPELDNLDFPSNRTDGDIEQVKYTSQLTGGRGGATQFIHYYMKLHAYR